MKKKLKTKYYQSIFQNHLRICEAVINEMPNSQIREKIHCGNSLLLEVGRIITEGLASKWRQTRSPGDFIPLEKWKVRELGEFFFKKLLTFCGNHDNELNRF